jgi:hypothetical protein
MEASISPGSGGSGLFPLVVSEIQSVNDVVQRSLLVSYKSVI